MTEVIPMVRKLQADALDPDVSVSALLRRAKVIATKLDQKDALRWIDAELNGFMRLTISELPPYRVLRGNPKAYNPYHGWQPIHFTDAEEAHALSKAHMGQSIGAIEQDLHKRKTGKAGHAMFPYSPEMKEALRRATGETTDFGIFLSDGQIWEIVEAVRNLVLNWSLELEKAGVLGADMTFSEEERREAAPVTQQFIIQNVGVLGNVGDSAKVKNVQVASAGLDLCAVTDFLAQAKAALPLLPERVRAELEAALGSLKEEVQQPNPSQSKMRSLMQSVRNISEGVAGNVIASGIVSHVSKILGA